MLALEMDGPVPNTVARQLGDVAGAGPVEQPLELDRTGLVGHVHPRDGDEYQPRAGVGADRDSGTSAARGTDPSGYETRATRRHRQARNEQYGRLPRLDAVRDPDPVSVDRPPAGPTPAHPPSPRSHGTWPRDPLEDHHSSACRGLNRL